MNTKTKIEALVLLLDECRGIYIPRDFVTKFDLTMWAGISEDDIETCSNPDSEGYWDAWNDILDKAVFKETGHRLYQDGSLWAIKYDEMSDEEYKGFFGVDRE